MKLNKKILLIFLLLLGYSAIAIDEYNIEIKINNYPDSALLLTSYYGDRIVLVDTAFAANPGEFHFTGTEKLAGGIYMAVSQKKKKLFEFVVDDIQKFSITTDTVNYSLNLVSNSSPNNKIFFDYLKINDELYRMNKVLTDSIRKAPAGSDEFNRLRKSIDSINSLSGTYKMKIIDSEPDLFVSKIFNAMRDLKIPDSLEKSNDSAAIYYYYKNHYWDFLDLSDTRFLRTPMLARKVDDYIKTLVVINPDSTVVAIDNIIAMARPSEEVVSWLVWHFTSVYQNPEYMGFDKVFIHLVDEYFTKEKITNATPSVIESLSDRADKMRPLLLGSPAPDLLLIDSLGNYRSFHSLTNKYIILFFWDYDCGICKKEVAGLKDIYDQKLYDFEVYAVCVNSDLDKWKRSLTEQNFKWVNVNGTRSVTNDFHDLYDTHSTPEIFVLDKERNIIAKNISAEQLKMFFENEEKRK